MAVSLRWNGRPRKGVNDLWNSGLYEGADWSELDNPIVPRYDGIVPRSILPWREAKRIHKAKIAAGDVDYHVQAHVHFFCDDQKFDGEREGVWRRWDFFLQVVGHFDGVLGVDFSTYADFPEPLKRIQFHKMRTLEHGAVHRGIPAIPNARWGTDETWGYCFDALPVGGMFSIGVVGSGLNHIENRLVFDRGFRVFLQSKRPETLIVVGSAKHEVFEEARASGIRIVQFDGETASYYKSRGM